MINSILLGWMPGWGEIVLIFAVILLLFGGKKIPELMRGLGKGIREFNNAKDNLKSELEHGMKEGDQQKNASGEQEKVKTSH